MRGRAGHTAGELGRASAGDEGPGPGPGSGLGSGPGPGLGRPDVAEATHEAQLAALRLLYGRR